MTDSTVAFIDSLSKNKEWQQLAEKVKTINFNSIENKAVDLDTFLFSKDYIGLEKVSPKQAKLLLALDKYDPSEDIFTEFDVVVGKGCITGDTVFNGIDKTAEELYKSKQNVNVLSNYNGISEMQGSGLWVDGYDYPVFEVELEDGKKIKVSDGHQFYTKDGWKHLFELNENDEIAVMG